MFESWETVLSDVQQWVAARKAPNAVSTRLERLEETFRQGLELTQARVRKATEVASAIEDPLKTARNNAEKQETSLRTQLKTAQDDAQLHRTRNKDAEKEKSGLAKNLAVANEKTNSLQHQLAAAEKVVQNNQNEVAKL